MMLFSLITFGSLLACTVTAHDDHDDQLPLGYVKFPFQPIYRGSNGEVTADAIFSGITTFAKLPWVQCLTRERDTPFDIAFIGAPFDTGTSYRPGARFGPVNPFNSGLRIVDCGDIPVTPYDNKYAIQQIEDGHKALLQREHTRLWLSAISLDGKNHPRIITLGDTWKPSVFGGAPSAQAAINHGTYFYWASQEGLINNGTSIASHGAIRTTLSGPEDYDNDDDAGFKRIEAREIDTIGTDGIIKKIRETIDSIDPAFAPATGTPETGGWSTRELRTILRGLDGLQIVSADIVEVAPAYDTNAELTTMVCGVHILDQISIRSSDNFKPIIGGCRRKVVAE
ncbi:hypothetical protein BDZ97DRAFT_1847953 [Flammula alnicola]|nr:hypothetical protein BDZ97DRAFT_1847953 [Flammula alnicola]